MAASTDPTLPAQLTVELRTYARSARDADWRGMLRRAETLDAAGVDRLVVSDHIAFGEKLDAYGDPRAGGRVGGMQPTGPDGHWLEPLTALAVIAGRTRRIRLGTNIILAALRRPAVLAKAAATLDVLSGGRLDLGVGVGWQRAEYEVTGLDYSRRGQLLDHTLAVCSTLWHEERASYSSSALSFDAIHTMPKPAQAGGVPIWISGTVNEPVVRRVATYGHRWIPWGQDADELITGIRKMRAALPSHGGDGEDLRVSAPLPVVRLAANRIDVRATMAAVPHLLGAGVTDFRIHPPLRSDPDDAHQQLVEIVSEFRTNTVV